MPRWGKALISLCQSIKHANEEIRERALAIENIWYRTQVQAEFVCQIDAELPQYFRRLQVKIYNVLEGKLKRAVAQLDGILKDGTQGPTIRKYKYALIKGSLDQAILDLESWQKTFDPSWFLVLRLSGRKIDLQLSNTTSTQDTQWSAAGQPIATAVAIRQSLDRASDDNVAVFRPPDGLKGRISEAVHLTSITLSTKPNTDSLYIIDTFRLEGPSLGKRDSNTFQVNARLLIHRLQRVDPSHFGILECRGAVRDYDDAGDLRALAYIFRPPQHMTRSKRPLSLREMLISGPEPSLTWRAAIAIQLATAVCYVHTLDLVHKNIRPENAIGLTIQDGVRNAERVSLFLFGFGQVRLESGATRRMGDNSWEKDLYRHPSRQGVSPQDDYVMQHDIYSLGICLLEIGLWGSLVMYDDTQSPKSGNLPGFSVGGTPHQLPAVLKAQLIATANEHLPMKMGDRYRTVVVDCLTCLDEGNSIFDDDAELLDDDGVRVGVRYIEKVLAIRYFAKVAQLT